MNKYKLLEDAAGKNKDSLPVFYKNLQFNSIDGKKEYFQRSTLYIRSERHQTNSLVAERFYKPITLFQI